MTNDEMLRQAQSLSEGYKLQGFHCSEATIRAVSEALGLSLSADVLRCAAGFRGGGGGYRDRCGIIEAGCMLISYVYGRLLPQQEVWPYSFLIRKLHERFQEQFNTIYCRDIFFKEKELKRTPVCMQTYKQGALLVTKLMLEAPELLKHVTPEEKAI